MLAYYVRSLTVCVVTEVISFVSSGISLVELYHVMLAAGLAPLTYRMNDHEDDDDGGGGNGKRQVDDVEYIQTHAEMSEGVKVNLIIQIYSIYLPYGTQSLKDKMGESSLHREVSDAKSAMGGGGYFSAEWFPLTWHCSKTLVPCTV